MNEQTNPEALPDDAEKEEPGQADETLPSPLGEGQGGGEVEGFDITQVKRVLEAALLSSTEPLTVQPVAVTVGRNVPQFIQCVRAPIA